MLSAASHSVRSPSTRVSDARLLDDARRGGFVSSSAWPLGGGIVVSTIFGGLRRTSSVALAETNSEVSDRILTDAILGGPSMVPLAWAPSGAAPSMVPFARAPSWGCPQQVGPTENGVCQDSVRILSEISELASAVRLLRRTIIRMRSAPSGSISCINDQTSHFRRISSEEASS